MALVPVASVGRSSSKLRIVKSFLRSTPSDALILLVTHSNSLCIKTKEIVEHWALAHRRGI